MNDSQNQSGDQEAKALKPEADGVVAQQPDDAIEDATKPAIQSAIGLPSQARFTPEVGLDPDTIALRPKPDAGPAFDLEPTIQAARVRPPSPIAVQEATARIAQAERREQEEAERRKLEEESLDGKPLTEPLVSGELKQWRMVAQIGVGVLVLGSILAFMQAQRAQFVSAIIAVYATLLHTALALGALQLQAILEQRPMGKWREALARFFLSLAVMMVVLHLPFKTGYEWIDKAVLALGACGAFLGCIVVLFRWPLRRAVMVGGIQVLIWVALTAHTWLREMVLLPK